MGQITPSISVITPVLNNRRDIEACLDSVSMQTYSNKEHWIIDGGSTDGTLEIVKREAARHHHIKWISEPDTGIYEAMNKGINKAGGEWIYFLGSDDQVYNNTVFEEVFDTVDYKGYDLLYGNIILKENGLILGEEISIQDLKWGCTHHQATFNKKSIFSKLGKYDTRFKVCADWAFMIKCLQEKEIKIKYINKIIAIYATEGFSNTRYQNNPRLSDKAFNKDFFRLFENITLIERLRIIANDRLGYYRNPFSYIDYLTKRIKVYKNSD